MGGGVVRDSRLGRIIGGMFIEPGPWNWLELAKLFVTPIVVSLFGFWVNHKMKRLEQLQWRSQKLVEKRLAVYDDIAPDLNDFLCYFTFVGLWKGLRPPDVVALKRKVDRKIHLAAPLFSRSFFEACEKFQNLCFETYTSWGKDAELRTQFERRKEAKGGDWQDTWDGCFSESVSDPEHIREAYQEVMKAFACDIGVHPSASIPPSGAVPANIR